MLLHIVNPNTTASMTQKIASAARGVASAGTEIFESQPESGPESIEGYYDEAFAVPGMLQRIAEAEAKGVAGHIIACFDDTGLDAARCLARAPVVGIGEAAFHIASLIAGRFSVVTTLGRSIPIIEHNLVRYGLASRCAGVLAAEVPVLELEKPGSTARARISQEIERAKTEHACEAIVLGCAGMADLATDLSKQHGLPVIDGVACAVALLQGVARLGLTTSKIGGYASPRPKAYSGMFANLSG